MADKDEINGQDLRKQGMAWIEKIKASYQHEKPWYEDAERAVAAYTGEGQVTDGLASETWSTRYDFNILYSNVETIVPAIINSPPAPDIRRRFADADPAAKDVAELLERAMRVQIDDSALQLEMEKAAHDAFLAGRGILRVRFKSDVSESEPYGEDWHELAEEASETEAEDDGYESDDEYSETQETITGERICFEAVSWRDYRHGPAKRWEDRPWEAFRHAIPMEDMETFGDASLIAAQTLPEDKLEVGETENDVILWEVWCKKDRTVKFIEENTGKIVKKVDDPLGLTMFFPTATPIQPIEVNGRLMPVNPFSIYRKLAEELDITTKRINVITSQMRVKGWYPGDATDLANMLEGGDNDFVPVSNAEMWAQNGGLSGAVAFWPIENFIQALRELYANRDQTKQAIYEITGLSDIVRGASKATETATAQNIKSQWGSLRIQKMQRMLAHAAREIFVMMAEIIPSKFSAETLQAMTGIRLIPTEQEMMPLPPPQPTGNPEQDQQALAQYQKAEQDRMANLQKMATINQLLGEKLQTYYRIDVESDSTVRADLTRQKQEVAEFLQGAGAYISAVGPMVQQGAIPTDMALEIFASNARMFNLGKSTEDAIEKGIEQAKQQAQQPKPPSPEELKAQAETRKLELEQQKAQAQAQIAMAKAQSDQATAQIQVQALQAKTQADIAKMQADIRAKEIDATLKAQAHDLEMQKGQLELVKTRAEIEKIRAGTAQTMVSTATNAMQAMQPQEPKK